MITRGKFIFYSALPPAIIASLCLTVYLLNANQGTLAQLAEYRLYRVLYALLAGGALAASGCFLQSTLRNPLVDHYILGVGSGALFASYIAIIVYGQVPLLTTVFAVAGGLLALALTILVAERISGSDAAYVLAGIGITSLFSGLSALLSYYAITKYPYAGLMLLGSFTLATRDKLLYALLAYALTYVGFTFLSKRLNALLIGDEYAAQLGVSPRAIRLSASVISGTAASVVVSMFGLVGFVGLVAPHIARFVVKTSDNRVVIPVASVIGALILLVADTFSRLVTTPVIGEVPAGAVVSVFGAPFFTLLVVRRFKRGLI